MTNIIGIATTRVSSLLVSQRLMQQVQGDQIDLFRLQDQLSTGQKFETPSEDPIASGRIITLQSLLERKTQVQTNLTTNQSFLTATDTALSTVSDMINDIKGAVSGVVGTTASNEERAAVAMQVSEAITQLLDTGNQNFRDRYLFAGSTTTVRPFELIGDGVVKYLGNETNLQSYADIDILFDTNVDGNYVFGAISDAVEGSVDLNPVLSRDTQLADLYGGEGISLGSIAISGGSSTSIIDLSGATTIGEVAQLIRDNPPEGRTLEVEITTTGLNIRLNQDEAGDLAINEVGRGTTANELGILTETGVGLATVVGSDLDPVLQKTTSLEDIVGSRARAVIWNAGDDNDIILEAQRNGADLNGVTIRFEDDPLVSAGSETVNYDEATGEIVIGIDENNTEASRVIEAINLANEAGDLPFTASLDPLDNVHGYATGLIPETPVGEVAATTSQGSGVDFDRDSGLQIKNGGEVFTVRFNTAETVEDVLNTLNGAGAGLVAQINGDGTGIDIRSRLSGADFAIGENGGSTASQLGVRTYTEETELADMNYGRGVVDANNTGSKAEALFDWGAGSQLSIEATQTGSEWNDFQVQFVDTGGASGSEYVTWDETAKTITIGIVPGVTTANEVVDLFAATDGPRDAFDVSLDTSVDETNDGSGAVNLATELTDGGATGGTDFIITRRDGAQMEIDIAGLDTIEDVLAAINSHEENADGLLTAQLSPYGNGIELVDESLGDQTLTIERTLLSTAAIDLGFISTAEDEANAQLAGTLGEVTVDSPGTDNALTFRAQYAGSYANEYQVVFEDTGSESFVFDQANKVLHFEIDSVGGTTAQDVIDMFNADPDASSLFTAELDASDGNDGSGAVAATDPLDPPGLSGGSPATLTADDTNPLETEGIFTALLRLETALQESDTVEIERAMTMLDDSTTQLNYVRAEVGASQQGLDTLALRLDAEEVELKSVLSEEYDVDLVEVISNLTARQTALQASMQAAGQTLSMTLLDYI